MESPGTISKEKIEQVKNVLNEFEKNPSRVLLQVSEYSKIKFGTK